MVLETARTYLEKVVREHIENTQKVLFLVSGGSNIELLKLLDPSLLAHPSVTVFPLDERYDTGQLNNSLLIRKAGIPIHRMIPESGESLFAFGQRYHRFLETWLVENEHGKVVALIGIGPDGHTAGISPGEENWFTQTFVQLPPHTWAIGYEGQLQPPQRVTVTPEFLQTKIDEGIIVATGEAKTEALEKLLSGNEQPWQLPATILSKAAGTMSLFTDVKVET